MRQLFDQARLDWLADTVRRENTEFRLPSARTRSLAGERAVSRWITWARGGPETGAAYLLERYHADQRDHYRRHMAAARRLAREQRTAEALTYLVNEQSHCERSIHDLKSDLQSLVAVASSPQDQGQLLATLD